VESLLSNKRSYVFINVIFCTVKGTFIIVIKSHDLVSSHFKYNARFKDLHYETDMIYFGNNISPCKIKHVAEIAWSFKGNETG